MNTGRKDTEKTYKKGKELKRNEESECKNFIRQLVPSSFSFLFKFDSILKKTFLLLTPTTDFLSNPLDLNTLLIPARHVQ